MAGPPPYPPQRPPYPPQLPPHYPEAMFINSNQPPRDVSGRSVTMPIVMVVTAGLFLVSVTYAGTMQFSDIKHQIEQLTTEIKNLTGGINDRMNRVETTVQERTRDMMTRTEHDLWCARTEQVNAGFRCGDSSGRPSLSGTPPRVMGWEARKQ